jgi:hypothetical protein
MSEHRDNRETVTDFAELAYEAPTVKLIGNARDLLAGAAGTVADAPPIPTPFQPG